MGRAGARRCRGYPEARAQSRKRPGEAAPRALPEEAPPGPLCSGSGWAMESMSELAPRCLLFPLLLLLPLLLLPAPKLGPSPAGAEETDWVRLPSKCEGEGAGPRGVAKPEGREGAGLVGRVWAWQDLGWGLLGPAVCFAAMLGAVTLG